MDVEELASNSWTKGLVSWIEGLGSWTKGLGSWIDELTRVERTETTVFLKQQFTINLTYSHVRPVQP